MYAYLLLLCAAVWHALDLGTIGNRGRIVHTLTGAGLLVGLLTGSAGIAGILAALLTVLACRHGWRWLIDGGWIVAVELIRGSVVPWAAGLVRACLTRMAEVFFPAPRNDVQEPVLNAQPEVSWHRDTAQVALPHGDRWGLLTPALESGDTAAGVSLTPALTLVETYSDWLPTAVDTCGGFNAAAKIAADRFEVSRSKFARDLRGLREHAAA